MRIPMDWLAEHLSSVPETDVLAERLTLAGLEVEGIEAPDPTLLEKLVVARIDSVDRHPDADRLSVCRVDDGEGERTIVCGASNMKAGDFVVLAQPGAKLPGGLKIKKSRNPAARFPRVCSVRPRRSAQPMMVSPAY